MRLALSIILVALLITVSACLYHDINSTKQFTTEINSFLEEPENSACISTSPFGRDIHTLIDAGYLNDTSTVKHNPSSSSLRDALTERGESVLDSKHSDAKQTTFCSGYYTVQKITGEKEWTTSDHESFADVEYSIKADATPWNSEP